MHGLDQNCGATRRVQVAGFDRAGGRDHMHGSTTYPPKEFVAPAAARSSNNCPDQRPTAEGGDWWCSGGWRRHGQKMTIMVTTI